MSKVILILLKYIFADQWHKSPLIQCVLLSIEVWEDYFILRWVFFPCLIATYEEIWKVDNKYSFWLQILDFIIFLTWLCYDFSYISSVWPKCILQNSSTKMFLMESVVCSIVLGKHYMHSIFFLWICLLLRNLLTLFITEFLKLIDHVIKRTSRIPIYMWYFCVI